MPLSPWLHQSCFHFLPSGSRQKGMLELQPGARWFRGDFPPRLLGNSPVGYFLLSQCVSEGVSHDPAACKFALVSLFRTAVIDYF